MDRWNVKEKHRLINGKKITFIANCCFQQQKLCGKLNDFNNPSTQ